MRFTSRDRYNLGQRLARKQSPERFKEYERTRYKKDREKRLYLARVCYVKKQFRSLGLEAPDEIVLGPTQISNLESIVKEQIEIHFPGYTFEKVRPEWLVNPKTNRNLELDLYCDLLKLAIEVQGKQHYEPVKKFDKSENSFLERQYRDQIKRTTCAKRGVVLLEFRYDDDISDLIDAIQSYINLV